MANEDYDGAMDYFDDDYCFDSVRKCKALIGLKNYRGAYAILQVELEEEQKKKKAKGTTKKGSKKKGDDRLDTIVIMIAQCYSALSQKKEAAGLIEIVIKEDEGNADALYEYAKIAKDFGKFGNALALLLRCIVVDQTNKNVKREICASMMRPDGFDLLSAQFPLTASTAPAYAFLSNVVRDHGGVVESKRLLGMCYELEKENAAYALNYIHGRELLQDYEGAWETCKDYLRNSGKQGEEMGCQDCLELIKDTDCFGKVGGEVGDLIICGDSGTKQKYTDTEQDVLAVYFVMCKILYLCGNFGLLPRVVEFVRSWSGRSESNLAKTTIRNENAYFMCVTQLLESSV